MSTILLLCEYPTISGGERSILATIPVVQQAGFDVRAIAPADGDLASAFSAAGVSVETLHVGSKPDERLSQSEMRTRLQARIEKARPDLIHANSLAMGRLIGPVADELGVPSVAHLRDILRLSKKAMSDLNRNRRLLAVSEAVTKYHCQAGLNREKTFTIYNGVDLETFSPQAPTGWLHQELNIPQSAKLIGAIGQICLRKGLDVFAQAALRVAVDEPDIHFLIIGSRFSQKNETQGLEQRLIKMAQGKLAGRWHMLGQRRDIDRLLPELSMLVHAARQEPLGRVLLEAAACGVPVIATDVGGTREIFPDHCHAAIIIPPDDSQRMASEFRRMLGDHNMRKQLSRAARTRTESQFDIRTQALELVKHYRAVLDESDAEFL